MKKTNLSKIKVNNILFNFYIIYLNNYLFQNILINISLSKISFL